MTKSRLSPEKNIGIGPREEQELSSQKKVQARKLKGFQDYSPENMKTRLKLMDLIRSEAGKAGFQSIATPALEYAEILLGVGGETDKQVYRFQDNGDRDVALRFDLTVPFARYVAENHGTLVFPFKRLQMGDVWRAEKPQKGRYREFCQCDMDIIGLDSIEADTEILLCILNILNRIDFGPFTISVGHRLLLSKIINKTLGSLDASAEQEVLIIIDKLEKVGRDKVKEMLGQVPHVNSSGIDQLLEILDKAEGAGTNLETLQGLFKEDSDGLAILENLNFTVKTLSTLAKDKNGKLLIDLSIARGLGYYTGIVFETTIDQLPGFGSICSGGRYNKLVERYLNRELPGIGGSIGLDRLLAAMIELGQKTEQKSDICFVAIAETSARAYGFSLAQHLRDAGIPTDIALKTNKLSQQFKYANRMQYPYVLTVGSMEESHSTVSLKIMETGKEIKDIPFSQVTEHLQN